MLAEVKKPSRLMPLSMVPMIDDTDGRVLPKILNGHYKDIKLVAGLDLEFLPLKHPSRKCI